MQPILTQIDIQIIDILETKLGHLAARWRGTENSEEADLIVRQYQAVLRCMIELGYRDALDVDAELPDEYMPVEYLDLFNGA
jgi:hypothetical protein